MKYAKNSGYFRYMHPALAAHTIAPLLFIHIYILIQEFIIQNMFFFIRFSYFFTFCRHIYLFLFSGRSHCESLDSGGTNFSKIFRRKNSSVDTFGCDTCSSASSCHAPGGPAPLPAPRGPLRGGVSDSRAQESRVQESRAQQRIFSHKTVLFLSFFLVTLISSTGKGNKLLNKNKKYS